MTQNFQATQPQNDRLVKFAGRNFSRFSLEHSINCLPVDEPAEDNINEANDIFRQLLGRAVLPRLRLSEIDEPQILECGFQKAAWIDDILDACPDAWVVGIDIFTGQGTGDDSSEEDEDEDDEDRPDFFVKKRWNLNASFRTSHDSDLRPETFHLINSRFLADGINTGRWETFVRELRSLLKPGGWLQMVEIHMLFQSDSGRSTTYLERWYQMYQQCLTTMGKDPRIGRQLQRLLEDAGFEHIHHIVHRLPIGSWIEGKESLGIQARDLVTSMLRSASLWPFLRIHQPPLTPVDYNALITGAQQELLREDLKLTCVQAMLPTAEDRAVDAKSGSYRFSLASHRA